MAGNSSVTGQETITFTDNMSFDGTQRGGAMTTNGQLWIGCTSGRHVRVGTLSSPDGSITVGYTFPNITLQTTVPLSYPITLANGGTSASLTASNGGIFYSTATAGAILPGTATANQALLSGSSTAPVWSTATYPPTTTVNRLLYSSATNTITDLATANSGVLITSAGGVPSISSTLPSAVQGNITSLGTIASGVWNGTAVTVPYGGTGATSFTAYTLLCAGTTSTGTIQNVASVGSTNQVLVSNGAATLPTFQDGWKRYVSLSKQVISGASTVVFTGFVNSAYSYYMLSTRNMNGTTNAVALTMTVSVDGGSNYLNSGYIYGSQFVNSAGSSGISSSAGAASWPITSAIANATGVTYNSDIVIYNFGSSTNFPGMAGMGPNLLFDSTATPRVATGYAAWGMNSQQNINAFKLTISAGNITGTFTLYGVIEA